MKSFIEFLIEREVMISGLLQRSQLPQLSYKHHEEFRDFLRTKGIETHSSLMPIGKLHPMQCHVDADKVARITDGIAHNSTQCRSWRSFTCEDHKILDGHHRWAVLKIARLPGYRVRVITAHTNFAELIALGHEFDKSTISK